MNKQRILLISIFVITFVIGVGAILVSNLITAPKKTVLTTSTNTAIPTLSSYSLACTAATTNTSLTLVWTVPSNTVAGYFVKGQINDLSTQSSPIQFGPVQLSQGSYVFTQANGTDIYYASLWVQDAGGHKGTILTTNQINSSQCQSGTQPIATVTQTQTATPTPTISTTITTTPTSTVTPTTVAKTAALACNTFAISQNGSPLTTQTVSPGSNSLTLTSGITSSTSATLNYTSAVWTISPSTQSLSLSSDKTTATWTPPTNTTAGTSFVISLLAVVDANQASLSTPCTVTITLSGSTLPQTAGNLPTIGVLLGGLMMTIIGGFLIFRKEEI